MSTSKVAQPPAPTSEGSHAGESLLRPEEHVLANLEAGGSRRWLFRDWLKEISGARGG